MEYRLLGRSGFSVPVLSFGCGAFGGSNEFFASLGGTGQDYANRLISLSLDHGVSMFDTSDIYSYGMSEEILGKALAGKRDKAIISTKGGFRFSQETNDVGSSRFHL